MKLLQVTKTMVLLTAILISSFLQAEDIKCNSRIDKSADKLIINIRNESSSEDYKLQSAIMYVWDAANESEYEPAIAINSDVILMAGESISLSLEPSNSVIDFTLLFTKLLILNSSTGSSIITCHFQKTSGN